MSSPAQEVCGTRDTNDTRLPRRKMCNVWARRQDYGAHQSLSPGEVRLGGYRKDCCSPRAELVDPQKDPDHPGRCTHWYEVIGLNGESAQNDESDDCKHRGEGVE